MKQTTFWAYYGFGQLSDSFEALNHSLNFICHSLSLDETVHHVAGTYLIKQYLIHCEGKSKPDWDLKGIQTLYGELETL